MQQGTVFTAVLFKNGVTDGPTHSSIEENDPFCYRGRIEIKFILILPWQFSTAFLFQTTSLHLGGYPAINTITFALFLK